MMKCKKHPGYKAKQKPRVPCLACMWIYVHKTDEHFEELMRLLRFDGHVRCCRQECGTVTVSVIGTPMSSTSWHVVREGRFPFAPTHTATMGCRTSTQRARATVSARNKGLTSFEKSEKMNLEGDEEALREDDPSKSRLRASRTPF